MGNYLCFCKGNRYHSKWMQFKKIDGESKFFDFPGQMFRKLMSNQGVLRINFVCIQLSLNN